MAAGVLIQLNEQPMDVLMVGVQRDGIPVLVVKPAPEGTDLKQKERGYANTGISGPTDGLHA